MIKKIKCNICNNKFYINKDDVKEVIDSSGSILKPKTYNAIDCPNCKCQKVLWTRLPEVKKSDSKFSNN